MHNGAHELCMCVDVTLAGAWGLVACVDCNSTTLLPRIATTCSTYTCGCFMKFCLSTERHKQT